MASVRRTISVPADPAAAWDAVRDFGAVHERLTPGVVTAATRVGDERVVTFASGAVVREVLVTADDEHHRLVYGMVASPMPLTHYSAAIEVRPDGNGAELVWTVDLLPDALADRIAAVMDQGAAAMRRALTPAG